MQKLAVLKGIGINTGEPQNWGALEFRSWDGSRGRPQETLLPKCATTSDLVVLWQRVYAQIEGNPKLGNAGTPAPLGWGVADPPKTSPLPISVTTLVLRQIVYS